MDTQLYVIGWKARRGDLRGVGTATYGKEVAEIICRAMNEEYPNLIHWPILVERKNEDVTPEASR